MKGTAMPLQQVWGNGRTQLVIPVYQRNYAWKIENCNQLFADLVKLKDSRRSGHFFGSIVTAPAGSGLDRLIIDGQQRLTTTSLLMLAAIKAVKDGKMKASHEGLLEEIHDNMLWAKYGSHPSHKFKLLPIEQDRVAYDRLFSYDDEQFIHSSKITRNFNFFYDKLTSTPNPFTFDELFDVVDKLQVICIDLDNDDDPQLIFESLNSTGLALEEADKIRNYLLMSLAPAEQEECFKEYWRKIQSATDDSPTMFLRDYITISDNLLRPVKLNGLYFHWKKYMAQEGRERKTELASMLDYVRYYNMISTAQISLLRDGQWIKSKRLSKKMAQLRNLDTDVINVFLISFLKYAIEANFSEDEIWKVLDLVEGYLARRIICSMSSNSLTQTFCALHRDVLRSITEYEKAGRELTLPYHDILAYHILRREGNFRIPRDEMFAEAILTRNVYQMPKSAQHFLFERLENFNHTEFIDVKKLMQNGDATIEHIMPQTLTSEWRKELGEDAESIHAQYLHTFANLTLTGVNSELSNNSFSDKKNGKIVNGQFVNGYQGSIYRLTQELMAYDSWGLAGLQDRAEKIKDKLMSLYPMPQTSYKPVPRPVEEISLEEEEFNPTNRLLLGYRLFGEEYQQSYWIDMLINVVRELYRRDPDALGAAARKDMWLHEKMTDDEKKYQKIDEGCYLWKHVNNRNKLSCLRYIFDELDIAYGELILYVEPQSPDSAESVESAESAE
ncbi:MAG: DUF262 domain-containing HNH endonuclease family protein [Muribaculaceae bacterium]|nr:DUF262 domain-containing HNH endonuclease family protein [Muribaculaceae bacterium]